MCKHNTAGRLPFAALLIANTNSIPQSPPKTYEFFLTSSCTSPTSPPFFSPFTSHFPLFSPPFSPQLHISPSSSHFPPSLSTILPPPHTSLFFPHRPLPHPHIPFPSPHFPASPFFTFSLLSTVLPRLRIYLPFFSTALMPLSFPSHFPHLAFSHIPPPIPTYPLPVPTTSSHFCHQPHMDFKISVSYNEPRKQTTAARPTVFNKKGENLL